MGSDIFFIGVPMYNFNIPSALKAWIDHIVRSGLTVSANERRAPAIGCPSPSSRGSGRRKRRFL
jgi:FMN-dependent NADH-azoreductase